jgi:Protein of unknown function (DUF3006)
LIFDPVLEQVPPGFSLGFSGEANAEVRSSRAKAWTDSVQLIVDFIEHDLAICALKDGRNIDVPLTWLHKETNPGNHLEGSSDGERLVQFSIDFTATQEMLERNRQALEQFNTGNDLG